jgi:hypothetical protein
MLRPVKIASALGTKFTPGEIWSRCQHQIYAALGTLRPVKFGHAVSTKFTRPKFTRRGHSPLRSGRRRNLALVRRNLFQRRLLRPLSTPLAHWFECDERLSAMSAVCVPFIINQTPAAGGDHCHGGLRSRVCGQSLRPSLAPTTSGDLQPIFSCVDSRGTHPLCVYVREYGV